MCPRPVDWYRLRRRSNADRRRQVRQGQVPGGTSLSIQVQLLKSNIRKGRVDNLSAAHVSDLNTTRHFRDGVVTDRRIVCAGHRSIRVPATRRRPNDDSREFDPNRIVNQAGVQRALADGDGAWPAIGQAVEVGPIDGIVLDQRKSGRLDVYPTSRVDHGAVPGGTTAGAAL